MRTHVGIAFVGTYYELSRFGYGKVDTRQGGAAGHEHIAQVLAGHARQLGGVGQTLFGTQMLMKQLPDLFFPLVDARQYDMARRLIV